MTVSSDIAEAAAKLRPEFDALLVELAKADEIVATILERWVRAVRAMDAVDVVDYEQLYKDAGYDDAFDCIAWLCNRLEKMIGGMPGMPDNNYPGQKYGWIEVKS